MSYQSLRQQYDKEHIDIVELELDFCANTYGVLPCTATGPDADRCVNTFPTCQDPENFVQTTKTYRFCESRSPHPIGIDAIPSLKSVSIAPTKIDLRGGLGVRASISATFTDHPHSDIGIDPYYEDRIPLASTFGSFWTRLRARNSNYQNRPLRVLSGYLVDGVFDIANFTIRYYVIDSLDVSRGTASIKGKDPLKLASREKALAPRQSTGKLAADLLIGGTSATLTPAGVGNAEYPALGKVLITQEVMNFTRINDVLSLTRAQNNTLEENHDADDTVQLCLEYLPQQVNAIVEDLLVTYAGIDPVFIPSAAWQSEVNDFLSGFISGIIVKPFDVYKLLQELAEAAPHYLWWDERTQLIQLTALKAPPTGQAVLDMDANFIADSFTTKDKSDLRFSTILVNFGQFDPTKRLDEFSNYQISYARSDADSVNAYGSDKIKTINSRWLATGNEAAARQLAALIGRRFSDIPREINFSLEAKDGNVWTGQVWDINHRDIVDQFGAPTDTTFQILSAKETDQFRYQALEFTYGQELPDDEGGGDPGVTIVFIPADALDTNLRTLFEVGNPPPTATTIAKFILDDGRKAGASVNTVYSVDTGTWPLLATVILEIKPTAVYAGKGGDAEFGDYAVRDGGSCLILNHDLELINNGIIGSGGGGGGVSFFGRGPGGGAGDLIGLGELSSLLSNENGSLLFGGQGERGAGGEQLGGDGGDLGQPGGPDKDGDPGGAAGTAAINKNGFTLTETELGDVRGAIIG